MSREPAALREALVSAGPSASAVATPAVALRQVGKSFPGVTAVDAVDLDIAPGEVHVFAGENGAGKSTLMRLIAQVEQASSGEILVRGVRATYRGPAQARHLGVAMVHQELALAPDLSVAENLFLGHEPGWRGWIAPDAERRRATELLRRVGLDLDPRRRVGQLSAAARQRVEIAKALAVDAGVLILDEPTASLSEQETQELFAIVRELTAGGVAVLFISHRLDEIFEIGDRVTVMRDGAVVETLQVADTDEETLVRLMVGRDVTNLYPRSFDDRPRELRLEVDGLNRGDLVRDVSFRVYSGEIVGMAGLVGAGRTETARTVFGAELPTAGTVSLDGDRLRIRGPADAVAAGIGYLTESRKDDGLALQLGMDKNITMARLPKRGGLLDLAEERRTAERYRERLAIRLPRITRPVQLLSGGNQQKVVVARWLETGARVLFFDEPGRGMDVAAKAEMFALMDELAADGKAVVFISSYLPELLNMCDRILVMRRGRIVGEVPRAEFSEERIVGLATGAGDAHD